MIRENCGELEGRRFQVNRRTRTLESFDFKHLARKGRTARVCLEATGIYSLDIAAALSKARGIEVMMANPGAVKEFAGALMRRSKDYAIDPVDGASQR